MKSKIKASYYVIPSKHLLHFVREAEIKFKNRDKNNEGKIKEFFECWNLLNNLSDVNFYYNEFLSDTDN